MTGVLAEALSAAVRQFRANYAMQVRKLPQLLKTAKAQPFRKPPPVGGQGKPVNP
jgi:hypothetical protein